MTKERMMQFAEMLDSDDVEMQELGKLIVNTFTLKELRDLKGEAAKKQMFWVAACIRDAEKQHKDFENGHDRNKQNTQYAR